MLPAGSLRSLCHALPLSTNGVFLRADLASSSLLARRIARLPWRDSSPQLGDTVCHSSLFEPILKGVGNFLQRKQQQVLFASHGNCVSLVLVGSDQLPTFSATGKTADTYNTSGAGPVPVFAGPRFANLLAAPRRHMPKQRADQKPPRTPDLRGWPGVGRTMTFSSSSLALFSVCHLRCFGETTRPWLPAAGSEPQPPVQRMRTVSQAKAKAGARPCGPPCWPAVIGPSEKHLRNLRRRPSGRKRRSLLSLPTEAAQLANHNRERSLRSDLSPARSGDSGPDRRFPRLTPTRSSPVQLLSRHASRLIFRLPRHLGNVRRRGSQQRLCLAALQLSDLYVAARRK